MLLHLLFAAAVAHGGELTSFSAGGPAPTLHFRHTVRAFLKSKGWAPEVRKLQSAFYGVRAATAVRIALEEISDRTYGWRLRTKRESDFPPTVPLVLEQLSTLQIGALTEVERADLRASLQPFVDRHFENRRALPTFRFAVTIYDKLGPRGAQDLRYLIEDIRSMSYLIGAYDHIRRIAPSLNELDSSLLRDAILRNPGKAIVRWTILDEIGLLPESKLVGAIGMLMHEMLPASSPEGISLQEQAERGVYLRTLDRWQSRLRSGDDVLRAAIQAAIDISNRKAHRRIEEMRFLERLGFSLLPTETSPRRLVSPDPLGLNERPPAVGNVLPFSCDVALTAVRY